VAGWAAVICVQGGILPASQSPPQFRAQTVLVPVDVRVIDADGKPITNLTAADFQIFENGVRQEIVQFSSHSFVTGGTPGRTFAIVLGRGHLNQGKVFDALIDFVRSRLQPEDRVCVFALLRATEPTTDRETVVRLLDVYRTRHDEIEDLLRRDESRNPAHGYRGGPIQPLGRLTRTAIEGMFQEAALPSAQLLPGTEMPLPYNDANYLWCALELLRRVEGEKHLVLLAQRPPASENARPAAEARVTVSLIQTGGAPPVSPTSLEGLTDSEITYAARQRAFAEQTGGIASGYDAAGKSLVRWANATSFQYLVGYAPARPPSDTEYRQIRVEVMRRGATVLYRHGYGAVAGAGEPSHDPREVLVRNRVLHSLRPRPRAPLPQFIGKPWAPTRSLSAATAVGPDGKRLVRVTLGFEPGELMPISTGAGTAAEIDVAVFVADAQDRRVGEHWERMQLRLDHALVGTGTTEIPRSITIAVSAVPASVRCVLYEYATDRLTLAEAALR
jgi:VWFA-related protein